MPRAKSIEKPGEAAAKKNLENNELDTTANDDLKVPTDPAALEDGPAYVRAVAAKVDLVGASAKLVVSGDEKIVKAELDRLRELIFGKGGPAPPEETVHIDWSSIPRPDRSIPRSEESSQGEERDH